MSRYVLPSALVALLVAGSAAAQSDVISFSRGSLIIPMDGTLQDTCGQASAYGLVWRLLKSNEPGGYNETHPVTVYLAINPAKGSPNRCVPSNRHMPPNPRTGWSDSRWNDGCDFTVTATSTVPVVPVDYSVAFPATGIYGAGRITNFNGSNGGVPGYSSTVLDANANNPTFRTIQYMGGPFVIDATDAANVIGFIRNTADMAPFRTTGGCNMGRTHYVYMHQALVQFNTSIYKRMNQRPPKLALLDSGAGVSAGILDKYLQNAGLDTIPGYAGCPVGTTSNCNLNGRLPGLIYDSFDVSDLTTTVTFPKGLLNAVDINGKLLYKVFWAPHWVSNASAAQMANIGLYARTRGTGIMAECASLESYEGSGNVTQGSPTTSFQFSGAIVTNGISTSWDGRNCTDPDYLALSAPRPDCTLYPFPADPFVQVGNIAFDTTGGHVHNYKAAAAFPIKPGVRQLGLSWRNYKTTDNYLDPLSVAQSADNAWNFFTVGFVDNNVKNARVLYLAGHTYANAIAGTRIVLNTLFNLGSDPVGSERALTSPVAFDDPNVATDATGTKALVINGTFESVSGYLPGQESYQPLIGSQWIFPYYPGHLRAHSLIGGTALATGESALDAATLWDAAAKMPLPHDRNLFTYFGGQVQANPTTLPAGNIAPHRVLQVGWVPEKVSGTRLDDGTCVDVLKLGKATSGQGVDRFDFIPGSDGVCDLLEATQYTTTIDPGTDFGASEWPLNRTAILADKLNVQQMLQKFRGYCFATSTKADGTGVPVLEPTNLQCNSDVDDNKAHLGGIAWSTVAVIPYSSNVPDASSKRRPTVAYAGGLDGQLHAFYVSGGANYTGPAEALSFPNPNATGAFVTNWSASFAAGTLPPAGTELWSFVPSTQLPWLQNNQAKVDSSPVVQDVFADFTGAGIREWHTVLAASTGGIGTDIFAIDVTNPLKPVLLWHLVGTTAQVGDRPQFSAALHTDNSLGGTTFASKWSNPTTNFNPVPLPDPGRTPTGLYDYLDLGAARGLTIGQLRAGLAPVYALFVASNMGNPPDTVLGGEELIAIDIATGQKVWQWEQPYASGLVDNTAPAPATVDSARDGARASRLYVGDMEGRIWELDATSGANMNIVSGVGGCSASTPCKYPLFDAQSTATVPQPFTTNIAVAKVPTPASLALGSFAGDRVLLAGTGGANWVPGTVPGKLHLLMLDDGRRVPVKTGAGANLAGVPWTVGSAQSYAAVNGVLQEPVGFPVTHAAGERLFGNITIAGKTAFYETAVGSVTDLLRLSATGAGGTYSIPLDAASTATPSTRFSSLSLANYGGVAVFHRDTGSTSADYVLTAEVSKISNTKITNVTNTGNISPDSKLNAGSSRGIFHRLLNSLQRFFQ